MYAPVRASRRGSAAAAGRLYSRTFKLAGIEQANLAGARLANRAVVRAERDVAGPRASCRHRDRADPAVARVEPANEVAVRHQ